MTDLLTADALIALVTLSALEIVLGIDNLVFITILTGRLPRDRQAGARRTGLVLALGMRIALLFAISWIMGLTRPLFAVLGQEFSGRDLILLGGGLFLVFKATWEIYDKLEVEHREETSGAGRATFASVITQIVLLDIVFSLDSVITAVGMANQIAIMVAAMVIAMLVMLVAMEGVSAFIERHPSLKILALSFLLLIGVMLVAEGTGAHVSKGYVYFAMAFSLGVELLNMRYRRRLRPVALHHRFEESRV
ncbi:MAG: TerC family protein [Candidatus Rokubacteria bacterium]|nr:TerC family protein [Candidatus Rokubacteria bacterium]